ncbi:SPOSA6832_00403 [Sporobolomyces salmonicolor]|uniref:SPOSA6832_00403-mRNA-1:cds n=1 Tax=Sporidiobolus salmonicolor TaxID=5005 RepID=A0A0D6EFY4_SPOSA|nr:SPOSA6832_00403 [Sporobolomyces salmonicolor]
MTSTLPPLAQAASGSVGAVISNALVFPLDTITTRLQASNRRRPAANLAPQPSVSHTIRTLYRSGGWTAFYSGIGPDSLSTALSQFLYFWCYSFLRDRLQARKLRQGAGTKVAAAGGGDGGKGKRPAPPLLSAVEELAVGCLAGVVAKGVVSPLSMITVRAQTASEPRQEVAGGKAGDERPVEEESDDEDDKYGSAPSAWTIAQDIYKEQGLKGFWSGFQSTVILTLNPAITFYAFAALQRALIPARYRDHPTPLQTFLCGAFASAIASAITYPLILAKVPPFLFLLPLLSLAAADLASSLWQTRLQFKSPTGRALYSSPIDVFRKAYAKQGISGLYSGVESQLLKGIELLLVVVARVVTRQNDLAANSLATA